jgi:hypothetical protein
MKFVGFGFARFANEEEDFKNREAILFYLNHFNLINSCYLELIIMRGGNIEETAIYKSCLGYFLCFNHHKIYNNFNYIQKKYYYKQESLVFQYDIHNY